jgi:hypothetical protein
MTVSGKYVSGPRCPRKALSVTATVEMHCVSLVIHDDHHALLLVEPEIGIDAISGGEVQQIAVVNGSSVSTPSKEL